MLASGRTRGLQGLPRSISPIQAYEPLHAVQRAERPESPRTKALPRTSVVIASRDTGTVLLSEGLLWEGAALGRGRDVPRWWIPALFAFALVLAACGGSGERASDAADEAGTSRDAPPPAPTQPAGPGPDSTQLQRWDDAVCQITTRFRDQYLATNDGVDPHLLPLEQRQARSEAQFPIQFGIALEAASRITLIEPPDGVAPLHASITGGFAQLLDALQLRREIVGFATTPEEIDAANPPARLALDRALSYPALLQQAGFCLQGGEGSA